MREEPIDLVIFDCDGVLIDSEVISARILIAQLGRVGVHVDFPYVQKALSSAVHGPKVAAEVRISYGLDLDSDFEERYRSDLLPHSKRNCVHVPAWRPYSIGST
jgi:beta-phosphoglucomutase-like phosphatase (HAD superfamily)